MEPHSRLRPVEAPRVYKRNLPHWELPGGIYFITFRTVEGFVLSDDAKDVTFSSIRFHADKKYRLYGCVVMKTHVHSVLQPIEVASPQKSAAQAATPVRHSFYSLAQVMHSIKSYSANRIQRVAGRMGSVWQDENYNRIVRDDGDYLEKMNYIFNNPVKAGLVNRPQDYRWLFVEGLT